ncbi:tRNA(Ile)(2)-agmatinylcytidine synthase [Halobacteria archaeon AArc-curdl1]|uniref:tRNA(Ile2) 2-agmatinylcytidine synthetase TiaS n=1 Tax=Natronosalvus hydrolyticus TaxID=2979988 RepID=A0AAP2Z8V7_9EURY|nr:tRNA(Ile)(2)-agmatinylcytidine synthase [Halobacteria archaeon AArc-curdl1]
MAVIGLDDTDSRTRGMCTTYVAVQVARALERGTTGTVERLLLIRLNPAVEFKTRGNAALAIHLEDADNGAAESGSLETLTETAYEVTRDVLGELAIVDDEQTNPGFVIAGHDPEETPKAVSKFASDAITSHLTIEDAMALADEHGYRHWGAGNGRGRIGAMAAVGAWTALEDWTYEYISYRNADRWGTDREVDLESVFAAAEQGYPTVWDTVDREEGETVCVPHTPGPILHGIRGDDREAVKAVANAIESEPVLERQLFVTNQGTDAHLGEGCEHSDGSLEGQVRPDGTLEGFDHVRDGHAYRLTGWVSSEPTTRRGGHVFFEFADSKSAADSSTTLTCAAFEPTKRFRDRVRALEVGDRLTVCGEVSDGTLKLEKFAVRALVTTERVTPTCPSCDRRMESAGRNQGYRCRDCDTSAETKVERPLERDLEIGWYEVPPCARRHIAKPLIRGGFDAPTHPER